MKTFVSGVCLWLMSVTFCQGQHRFGVSASIHPAYSHLRFAADLPVIVGGTPTTWPIANSLSSYGYNVGVGARYGLGPRWTVSAGIGYTYLVGHRTTLFSDQPPVKLRTTSKSYTLQVPVLVNYRTSSAKLAPPFSAGLVGSHHYRDRTTFAVSSGSSSGGSPDSKPAYPDYVSGFVGAGIDCRLSTRASLVIQPYSMYQLNKPASYYSLYRNFQAGVQVQFWYRL